MADICDNPKCGNFNKICYGRVTKGRCGRCGEPTRDFNKVSSKDMIFGMFWRYNEAFKG